MRCYNSVFYVAGLCLAFAYDNISYNKAATQSHTWVSTRYDASNAVDGNAATCMRTQDIGSSSIHKTVWWKVDLGGVYNVYSINILFKNYDGYVNRQRGRFAGFSLYISNTGYIQGSTLCYKYGPQLHRLNFTTICTESGRYVIFYNERFKDVVYPKGYEVTNVLTELCEVTVQGCNNASFYGTYCTNPCPTNCKDNTCHIQSGSCFNCKSGWTGDHCNTKCREGWYGFNCIQRCIGHCRERATCNHVTGQCDGGCNAGWTGVTCDQECVDGRYGYNCINNCSGHCLNNTPCHKQTGQCEEGCNPGYSNDDCNKECSSGQFGLDCSQRCSGHCINNVPCDHVSGVCFGGCRDGYHGAHCTAACKEGFFGTNCSQVCSPNCKSDTCRHTDGLCTSCTAGWTGYNCTTECVLSYGDNCRYPCNAHCVNQTCDRINGSCLYECREGVPCDRDVENYMTPYSSSNHLPIIAGGTFGVGTCMFTIVVVAIAICVIRRKSSNTKGHSNVHHFCWKSTSAVEQRATNYQELNFSSQENPYQSMSP